MWIFSIWADHDPSRALNHLKKKKIAPSLSRKRPFLSCLPRFSKKVPKHYMPWLLLLLLLLPLVAPTTHTQTYTPNVECKCLLLKTLCTSDNCIRGPWTVTDLKVFPLSTSFHGTQRHRASFQKREATYSPAKLWCLWTTMTSIAW